MRTNNAFTNFLLSQMCLFGSILLCVLLIPDGVAMNKGISWFSSQVLTIVPYSLGLLGTAWFVHRAGKSYQGYSIRYWTISIAVLLVIIVAFPFAINETLKSLHRLFSASLFLTQLAFTAWLTLRLRRDILNLGFVLGLIAIIIGTLFYISPVMRLLIVGEVGFQFLFAVAMYRTLFAQDAVKILPVRLDAVKAWYQTK